MFKHILVVCTGNICRSPMGEALLRKALPDRAVVSAGTEAMVGWQATEEARAVMKAHGYDLSRHHARQLSPKMLAASDLVLTMDQTHSDWINKRYPQYRGKVHKLLKWQDGHDVEDPYGHPLSFFEHTYEDIAAGVKDWLKRV